VVVSAQSVDAPEHVRYGWSNSPLCRLYNRGGLPASPFSLSR
jgi:sialate O-acetylesterase